MGGIEEIHERVTQAFGAVTQEDWGRTPASVINLIKIIADCFREEAEKIRQHEQRIIILEQENQILREQLGRNSGNSSMPPSSDIKSVTGKKQRKGKSGKRRGGQPGHIGYKRKLTPTEECQKVEDHYPEECKKCGALLSGEDPDPYRHQVVDIPPITPQVEEHRLHKLICKGCGTETRASLPCRYPDTASALWQS